MVTSLAKVFVMTRNEYDLIEDFLVYYGTCFGYANVVVLDDQSNHPDVLAIYEQYAQRGVTVIRDPRYGYAGSGQAVWLSEVIRHYRDSCKFIIPVDTDELMFYYPDLEAGRPLNPTRFHDYLESIPGLYTFFKVCCNLDSVNDPDAPGYSWEPINRPMQEMTLFQFKQHNVVKRLGPKCFFRSDGFIRVEKGSHSGRMERDVRLMTDIGLFHYHHTGYFRRRERATKHLLTQQYFEPEDLTLTPEEQLDLLISRKERSPHGRHYYAFYIGLLRRQCVLNWFKTAANRRPGIDELNAYSTLEGSLAELHQHLEKTVEPGSAIHLPADPDADARLLYREPSLNPELEYITTTHITDFLKLQYALSS